MCTDVAAQVGAWIRTSLPATATVTYKVSEIRRESAEVVGIPDCGSLLLVKYVVFWTPKPYRQQFPATLCLTV